MKLKYGLGAVTVATGLVATSYMTNNKNIDTSLQQEKIPELMHLIPILSRDSLLTLLKNKDIDSSEYDCYLDTINKKPNTDTLTIDMDRIKSGPIGTMKVVKNLSMLLGDPFSDSLFSNYNLKLYELFTSDSLGYETIGSVPYHHVHEDIKVPAVYPEIADFFVPSLEDFLVAHPEMLEQIGQDKEVIILTRDENGKYVIGYYKDGYIDLAQYSSPGTTENKSPEGVYYTNLNKDVIRIYDGKPVKDINDRQYEYKKSQTYDNAPMPYYIPIAQNKVQTGVAFHLGKVNGNGLSHGCFRIPGYIAVELYDRIDNRIVKVVIADLYGPRK